MLLEASRQRRPRFLGACMGRWGQAAPALSGADGQAFGGVAASSSVPALAARRGSRLMGFSSQML